MKSKTVEDLLQDHMAACLGGMENCLAEAQRDRDDDPYGHRRRGELAQATKLMKASARLTEALAKLRGESRQEIHVVRSEAPQAHLRSRGDRGQG